MIRFRPTAAFFGVVLGLSFSARAQQPPEFRALWADTFHAGMRTSSEVTALVNTARNGHFNAIIVEVRKRGDAYYNSSFEPKAVDVSPQSFDPLADLIAKAHNGGPRVEVHAWMTTYLIWNSQVTPPSQPSHPYNLHPEWLSQDDAGATWDGGNYQFDPSHPEVQKHVYNVAMDIISRYDVDGLNFDYVRYTAADWGYHPVALDRFQRRYNRTDIPGAADSQWKQFRRDQVSGLVRKVYLNTMALKPQVKISADTICFAPGIIDDAGWFNSASAWNNVLQDWRGWMQEGILDLNVPMMYFDQRRYSNDWSRWSIFAKEHQYGHHVALGQGSYLNTLSNMIYQLRTTRTATPNSNAVPAGIAVYSYAVPVTNDTAASTAFNALVQPSGYDPITPPIFTNIVSPPEMTWKTAPTLGHLKGTIRSAATSNELDGALVSISGPVSAARTNDATGFYGFAHLPPGVYTVTASYSNLLSQSALVTIATGAVTTLDFALGTNALFNVRAFPGEREALFAWSTAVPGDSEVGYGLAPDHWQTSWRDPALVTNHVVLLTGLSPNTQYYFDVQSRAGTNHFMSEELTFRTAGEIILDNPGAALAGAWTVGTASLDKYGVDYVFSSTAGNAASATYAPNIATPGRYDVYVAYPQGSNRSTNAPWLLAYDGGTVTGAVNQTTGGGVWQLIATNRPFARGTAGYFRWQNQTAETGKVVLADAVRFVYVTNQEPAAPGTVPQWWSDFFFGGTVNPALDPDGDAVTTAQEYVAGTDPTRAASRLQCRLEQITNYVVNVTGHIAFRPYHEGRRYVLESNANIGTNDWQNENVPVYKLNNSDGDFPVILERSGQKFYRLRVGLAP